MSQMNIPGVNQNMPAMGNMPMMNNLPNGAMPRQMDDEETLESNEAKLNHWIYAYFLDKQQWDAARSLKNGSLRFEPPLGNADEEMNGVNEDSKNNINDSKRPADLPSARVTDREGGSLLPSWFNLFWDMFDAQRGKQGASAGARQVIDHNRIRRDQQMYRAMTGMMPTQIDPNMQQILRMNGMNGDHLRQKAMQNQQQNGFRGMNPQMVATMQRNAMMQQQQGMRRDPSVDMNGQRPRTPGSGEHAPSPKRPRMDVANGFNPQMMQNGRPPPGMPPQMMGEAANQTNAMLLSGGVNPGNLSESQYASFQQQNPAVQQKSIQVFAQNMSKSSREDAMNMGTLGPNPEFFPNGARPMPGHMGANPGANGAGGNHALQDYQMQLMLLEQQNKKRLLMARQEQEGPPQPGMPLPNYVPGMSPSGSRGGPSPGPGERRGTPKIGQGGSPLPEGSLRGSPAALNAFNSMPPEMYPQMNGGMRPPPNGNSNFAGQFNPQQMEQMRAVNPQQGRMPNGNWQQAGQGPQGQPPMNQQQPSQPQPAQIGTPQPRNNDMPPPQAPPPGAVNGRPGADDAPPTPQPNPKPNPKKKNTEKKVRAMQSPGPLDHILNGKQKPTKKNSTSVAATPASEAENAAATPTPATPVTPAHRDSFASKAEGLQQSNPAPVANDTGLQMAAPPADLNPAAQFNASGDGSDANLYNDLTDTNMNSDNLLDSFNFEEFLDAGAISYDFGSAEISEPMMGDAA